MICKQRAEHTGSVLFFFSFLGCLALRLKRPQVFHPMTAAVLASRCIYTQKEIDGRRMLAIS